MLMLSIVALPQEPKYTKIVDTSDNKQQVDHNSQNNLTTDNIQLLIQKAQIEDTKYWLTIYLAIAAVFVTAMGIFFPIFLYSRQQALDKETSDFKSSLNQSFEEHKGKINKMIQDLDLQLSELRDSGQKIEKQKKNINKKVSEMQKLTTLNMDIDVTKEKLEQIMKDITTDTKKQKQVDANSISNGDKRSEFIDIWSKSLLLYCSDKYDEAAKFFQTLLNKYSERLSINALSDIYRLMSVCYIQNNDAKRALSFSESAVYLNPDNYYAWTCKGVVLQILDKKEDALECYEISLKIYKDNENAWYNKADVLDSLNKKDDMLNALNRSLEINQNYDLSLALKGCILHQKGDTNNSQKCFDNINPNRIPQGQLADMEKIFIKYNLVEEFKKKFQSRINTHYQTKQQSSMGIFDSKKQ
jgi:tetratricopeptide (TPR) repeat protein